MSATTSAVIAGARVRTATASASGTTPSLAQPSVARISTSSQVVKRASSVNKRDIAGSEYRGIKPGSRCDETTKREGVIRIGTGKSGFSVSAEARAKASADD